MYVPLFWNVYLVAVVLESCKMIMSTLSLLANGPQRRSQNDEVTLFSHFHLSIGSQ